MVVGLGTTLMRKSAPVPTFTFSQLDLRRTIVRTCVPFYFFFQTLWSRSHATMLLQILVLADIIGSAWPEAVAVDVFPWDFGVVVDPLGCPA